MVLLRVNIFFSRLVFVLKKQAEQEGPGLMNVPIARSHVRRSPLNCSRSGLRTLRTTNPAPTMSPVVAMDIEHSNLIDLIQQIN